MNVTKCSRPMRAALVGTYPPTRCGIATFTRSLARAWACGAHGPVAVIRVMGAGDPPDRDPLVSHRWRDDSTTATKAAAAAASRADVVIVQHEYGIYPGEDGADVVRFVAALAVPSIVVLHTAVAEPTARQRRIVEVLARMATPVVQSESARRRVLETTSVEDSTLRVIPHGATHVAGGGRTAGDGRRRLLTWGLLGPGKGIEHVIRALAQLRDLVPSPHYTVAGQTHPKVLARDGEAYRHSLVELTHELGIDHMVSFDDRYRTSDEVIDSICGADLAVLPYDSRDQVTSGVLVEALAAGCPVIATAFPHAIETLSGGAGITVPHEDPTAMAHEIRTVLTRPNLLGSLRRQAAAAGRELAWERIADHYADVASRLAAKVAAA